MIKVIGKNVFSAKKNIFVNFYFYPVLFINLFFAYIKSYKCQVYLFNYPPHRRIWVIFLGGTNENGPYEHGNNPYGDLKN